MATENKSRRNEIEVELLDVTPAKAGVFSQKQNKHFWFVRAEIPATGILGALYSTIRLEGVSNEPYPPHWIPGATVRVRVTNVNTKDGKGEINVPQA